MSHDPGHPGAVDDGWRAGSEGPRSPLDVVRTVVAAVVGLVAVLLLAGSWLLVVVAVHVTTPDHPGRLPAVLLAVPEIRADAADALVDDVEEELGRTLAPDERSVLAGAFDVILGSDEVERALDDLEVVDGSVDARPFLAVLSDQLRARALGPGLEQETADVLRQLADGVAEPAGDGAGPVIEDVTQGLTSSRNLTLGAAGVLLVPGVVAASVCVAVARRRARAWAVVVSGSLVVVALALTPVASASGTTTVGLLLEALAAIAGRGTVWLLLVAALLPPAVLAAVAARRTQRESSTITS